MTRESANRSNGSEVRCVEGAAAGSPAALGEIYARHSVALYGLALSLTGSPADASDVVHDVFAGLPEALRNSYEERGRFRAWLLKLTTRTALMKLRRRRHRREVSFEALPYRARVSLRATAIDRGVQERTIDRVTLERAVEALPDALRSVFMLKAEGLSHAEIGEALGISEGASRVRLYRAHEQLRRLI